MIYPAILCCRYKVAMETGPTSPALALRKAAPEHLEARDTFSAQTPLVVIGLAAIGMIFLINSHARPTPPREKVVVIVCAACGTVVAVRPATNAAIYTVEVQMLDGSLRTTLQETAAFSVGDIVQVNGNMLTLRSAAS